MTTTTTTTADPKPLTARQREVLDFIKANMHLYSPTIREIAKEFSFRSPQGVVTHLDALERKGWIRRARSRTRGIEVLRGN